MTGFFDVSTDQQAMNRPSISAILSDLIGLVLIAGLSLAVGMTVNCFRAQPLGLLTYPDKTDHRTGSSQPEIALADLQKMIGRPDVRIIDARPPAFFALGHLPGAVNVPLPVLQNPHAGVPLPPALARASLIVVYCQDVSCPAAVEAARLLEQAGYRRVTVFPGGWYAWKKAGLPRETSP
jgi:rhodanese-related sulfurtransferase